MVHFFFKLCGATGLLPVVGSTPLYICFSIQFLIAIIPLSSFYRLTTTKVRINSWNDIFLVTEIISSALTVAINSFRVVCHHRELRKVNVSGDMRLFHPEFVWIFGSAVISYDMISALISFWSYPPVSFILSLFTRLAVYHIQIEFCTLVELQTRKITLITQEQAVSQTSLEHLCDDKEDIVSTANFISEFFSPQMFLMSFTLFVSFVHHSFQIIHILRVENRISYSLTQPALLVVWQLIQLIDIAKTVEDFSKKNDEFNEDLLHLMRHNSTLLQNKKLQLCVRFNRTVDFTGGGFFSLGYPLVTAVIASSITYLVIIGQFD